MTGVIWKIESIKISGRAMFFNGGSLFLAFNGGGALMLIVNVTVSLFAPTLFPKQGNFHFSTDTFSKLVLCPPCQLLPVLSSGSNSNILL
jgi:hypothetical protein